MINLAGRRRSEHLEYFLNDGIEIRLSGFNDLLYPELLIIVTNKTIIPADGHNISLSSRLEQEVSLWSLFFTCGVRISTREPAALNVVFRV